MEKRRKYILTKKTAGVVIGLLKNLVQAPFIFVSDEPYEAVAIYDSGAVKTSSCGNILIFGNKAYREDSLLPKAIRRSATITITSDRGIEIQLGLYHYFLLPLRDRDIFVTSNNYHLLLEQIESSIKGPHSVTRYGKHHAVVENLYDSAFTETYDITGHNPAIIQAWHMKDDHAVSLTIVSIDVGDKIRFTKHGYTVTPRSGLEVKHTVTCTHSNDRALEYIENVSLNV